jgi:hypothetical protein
MKLRKQRTDVLWDLVCHINAPEVFLEVRGSFWTLFSVAVKKGKTRYKQTGDVQW